MQIAPYSESKHTFNPTSHRRYDTEGAIGVVVNKLFTVVLSFAQNYTSFGMGWKASPDIRDFEHHPTYQDAMWQAMWNPPWGFVGIGGSGGGYTTIGAYNVETGYNQGAGPYPVRWYRYMRSGNAVPTSSAAGPRTLHASGTISTPSDKVLCMIGHFGSRADHQRHELERGKYEGPVFNILGN
jgi:hypothetical protein